MANSFILVLTTFPKKVQARRVARLILQNQLAACVNILGSAESLFWWEGKIDQAKEHLVLIKTKASRFEKLRSFLQKNHPYSVPEIIALPIRKGNPAYLDWIGSSLH